jgi:hypothetical protein
LKTISIDPAGSVALAFAESVDPVTCPYGASQDPDADGVHVHSAHSVPAFAPSS